MCVRFCAAPLPASSGAPYTTLKTILWFYLMILFEGVPPKTGCGTNAKTLAGNSKTEPAQSS